MKDFTLAAVKAAETLVRFMVKSSPVSPLPILHQIDNVIAISFTDLCESSGIRQRELTPLFGVNRDAITSIHTESGKPTYVVAYDSMLPFNLIQRALARELGHIILQHDVSSPENTEEAICFAQHLLCPRPLIHAIQVTGLRITMDLLANLTGIFDQSMVNLRNIPGTDVPAGLNRFVRGQFMPFIINFFDYYRTVIPQDGSALADFGTYMDGYIE